MSAPLTPEQVSSMSDVELSEAVAREVFGATIHPAYPAGAAGTFVFRPSGGRGPLALVQPGHSWVYFGVEYPAAVDRVLETMRRRWKDEAPDSIRQLDWYIAGFGEYWAVGRHHCGASGEVFPLHDGTLARNTSLGRAVFECALLSVQPVVEVRHG